MTEEELKIWRCPITKKDGYTKLREDEQKQRCATLKGFNFLQIWEDEDPRTFFKQNLKTT